MKDLIHSATHLKPATLHNMLNQQRKEEKEAGNEEKYNLLTFIHEIVNREHRNDELETITDTLTLYKAAIKQRNIIRLKSLLIAHKNFVNLDLIQLTMGGSRENQIPLQEDIMIMFVASLIIANIEFKMIACLLWVRFLFHKGLFKKGKKRIDIAKKQMSDSQKDQLQQTLLALEIAYARERKELRTALQLMENMRLLLKQEDTGNALFELLYSMARIARELGQYEKSIGLLDELFELLNIAMQQPDINVDQFILGTCRLRGLVLEDIGRGDLAQTDYQQAYNISIKMGDKHEQFVNLTNIAISYVKLHRKQESLFRLQQLLQTVREWGDPITIASTHNNIGSILQSMERYTEALSHYYEALEIKVDSPYKFGEAVASLGIADCYLAMNNPDLYRVFHSYAFVPILQTGDVGLMATYAIGRAAHYTDESEQDQNRKDLMLALNIAKSLDQVVSVARLIPWLCQVYERTNKLDDAIALCHSFLEEHPNLTTHSVFFYSILATYARLLLVQEAPIRHLFDKLMHTVTHINKNIEETIFDKHRGEMVGQSILLYNTIFRILLEYKGDEVLINEKSIAIYCFNLHELAKSRTFLSDLSVSRLTLPENVPEALGNKEQELIALQLSYQQMENAYSEAYRLQRLQELRMELFAIRDEIKLFAPDYVRARAGLPYQYEEAQAFLDREPHVAFISFFCDTENTTVFVVLAEEPEPRVFRYAVGSDEIEKVVKQMQRAFNGAPFEFPPYPPILPDRPFERELDFLDQLGASLLGFTHILTDVEVLCIAAHGVLHQVPFHAIRLIDGRYLAEQFAVVYTASISTTLLQQTGQKRSTRPNTVYVACVPSKEDKRPDLFEQDLDLFDPHIWPKVSTDIGIAASREKVYSEISGHNVIHFSCHGYFDNTQGHQSGLILSNGIELPTRYGQNMSFSERNQFALTAKDLLSTHIDADLITLNACSTALQENRNHGDEWDGFIRCLLLAGASSVLSTMWNVDQASSAGFLKNFYAVWKGGASEVEKWKALSYAQRSYIYSENIHLRHPYHWAAFTLSGTWH
ncbi:CHAT domain-containing protein [Chitinophaga filiformis]|uniref:CHAT domain-containing protein n=1 Tax=Chitinophaga filiformis TaxID=104663 RepID=A0ABY4HX10_CHIFI|nr:CHAT domain-containing tetratricopeptide repeat protein [Chitinophaga filiformis]UPK67963.1 CHAT domain-containing protein [Chitinophaga filiformis]